MQTTRDRAITKITTKMVTLLKLCLRLSLALNLWFSLPGGGLFKQTAGRAGVSASAAEPGEPF